MKNIDVVKVTKGIGMLLSISGMIVTSWVTGKENEKVLEKLLEKRLGK